MGPRVDVVAVGTGLTYRWLREGVELPEATSSSLRLTRVGSAAVYECVISDACGTVVTEGVRVDVCAGDYDADGFIDFFDDADVVAVFEGGC